MRMDKAAFTKLLKATTVGRALKTTMNESRVTPDWYPISFPLVVGWPFLWSPDLAWLPVQAGLKAKSPGLESRGFFYLEKCEPCGY